MSKQNTPPITATPIGRILSTEDDPDTRDLLRLLLKLEGFEIVYADNAEEALSLAGSSRFDLYLLDNWVPGLAGEDLCRKLREFDQTTPILFYSGAGDESDKDGAIAAGAQGYVVKPAAPDELTSQVLALIK
ncbi:MAG: two-component system, OmpR family, response regulator RegX3 [Blastocatellia bacterium]|jgi:DNA-binding response OmpR family regulator|nr:two-component system, OmpR family, response regulator RegX3 [Blastocatellia bacterium]